MWGGKKAQCLVLDPNSLGVAGVLRHRNDTTRIAQFWRSNQLDATGTVQLSTGESVSCYPGSIAGCDANANAATSATATSQGAGTAAPRERAATATTTNLQCLPHLSRGPQGLLFRQH